MRNNTRHVLVNFLGGIVAIAPFLLILGLWTAWAYFAPCTWMGGCSPNGTPNRCQGTR